ncbi:MAG TPA: RdgB/HAM1 family non-canonical purine NTP pyrophosphatase [Chloroflexota bacterium]|nr:RdgB/HAM1 family non-canonical purine NTP pyrophosphatase [Chloroflexota bacterium]
MTPRPRLLLATTSPAKQAELRQILAGLPLTLVTPGQLGLALEVEETGETFAANAILKAEAFAHASGLAALADDSGLEIDALGGAPGVRSHRYAGPQATDADRIALVLRKLEGVPDEARTARFRCVMALATRQGVLGTVEGICEGRIARQPRGEGGFGYDPIFFLPDRGRTMAELLPKEKHAVSHRGRAGRAAYSLIEAWLAGGERAPLQVAPSASRAQGDTA